MPLVSKALLKAVTMHATASYYGPLCQPMNSSLGTKYCSAYELQSSDTYSMVSQDWDQLMRTKRLSDCFCYKIETIHKSGIVGNFGAVLMYDTNEPEWLVAQFGSMWMPPAVAMLYYAENFPQNAVYYIKRFLNDTYLFILDFLKWVNHWFWFLCDFPYQVLRYIVVDLPKQLYELMAEVFDMLVRISNYVWDCIESLVTFVYDHFWDILDFICRLPYNFVQNVYDFMVGVYNFIKNNWLFDFITPVQFVCRFLYEIFF